MTNAGRLFLETTLPEDEINDRDRFLYFFSDFFTLSLDCEDTSNTRVVISTFFLVGQGKK